MEETDTINVSLKDLDYTLHELSRYKAETFKLRKVKADYDRLVQMTDHILAQDRNDRMGEEYGPVQILEKAVAVKKAKATTATAL